MHCPTAASLSQSARSQWRRPSASTLLLPIHLPTSLIPLSVGLFATVPTQPPFNVFLAHLMNFGPGVGRLVYSGNPRGQGRKLDPAPALLKYIHAISEANGDKYTTWQD